MSPFRWLKWIPALASTVLGGAIAGMVQPGDEPDHDVAINGEFENVFTWQTQRCETWDVPDAPMRAFRDASGRVVAFASDERNRYFTGRSILDLKHSCAKALLSAHDPDPAARAGSSFITATWTKDGRHVAALVHNEYHADRYPRRCKINDSMGCWYNVIVAASSADGGQTFTTTRPPALVAGPAFRQDIDQGRHRGFFNPTNIVAYHGAFYFMAGTTGGGPQHAGICLFRSADPSDPTSWRGYMPEGFQYRSIDPYRSTTSSAAPCQPIAIGGGPGSISYHAASRRYLAVMQTGGAPDAPDGAIRYSWSSDLVHWSRARILMPLPILGSRSCRDAARYAYPSVLDPGSGSRNFDVIESMPYLFLTRMRVANCHETVDRDLIRIRLHIG